MWGGGAGAQPPTPQYAALRAYMLSRDLQTDETQDYTVTMATVTLYSVTTVTVIIILRHIYE